MVSKLGGTSGVHTLRIVLFWGLSCVIPGPLSMERVEMQPTSRKQPCYVHVERDMVLLFFSGP